jgi:hypothetical protein
MKTEKTADVRLACTEFLAETSAFYGSTVFRPAASQGNLYQNAPV